ncbi:hypothetical protein AU512_09925 [Lonsdalea iberica]|uniref:Uncharacterized protein n=1 Tax=Lonsdalea iberica TaxID=1082703 RepID=A0ABX3XFU1_9GAMM|nr:hypothetical protein AU512_09925 [Lonsdalea iberica]
MQIITIIIIFKQEFYLACNLFEIIEKCLLASSITSFAVGQNTHGVNGFDYSAPFGSSLGIGIGIGRKINKI